MEDEKNSLQLPDAELALSLKSYQEHSAKYEHEWVWLAKNKSLVKNTGNPPTHEAIRFFKARKQAVTTIDPFVIDFGIGCGADALPYLKQGWRVTGVDAFPEIISHVQDAFSEYPKFDAKLTTLQHMSIAEKADIVSCVTTFTWNPKSDFPIIWKKVLDAVKEGGIFSFDLYGTKHQWFNEVECFFTKEEVFTLIEKSNLTIHWQQYYDEETQLVDGGKARFEYWEFVCEKVSLNILGDQQSDQAQASEEKKGGLGLAIK